MPRSKFFNHVGKHVLAGVITGRGLYKNSGAVAILSHRKTAKIGEWKNENRMEYFTRRISRNF